MVDNDKSRLSRDRNTADIYDHILEGNGPLSKKNKKLLKDIFMVALAYGVLKKIKIPIQNKERFIRRDSFGEYLPSLINALAITNSEEGGEVLSKSPNEIYDGAEKYANGGIEVLKSLYFGNEEAFIEELRLEIIKLNKDDRILKKINDLNF